MVWVQGSQESGIVAATSVGAAVTFTSLPNAIFVRNDGASDVFFSVSSTAGSTGGFRLPTAGTLQLNSRTGFYSGFSVITTAAASYNVAYIATR